MKIYVSLFLAFFLFTLVRCSTLDTTSSSAGASWYNTMHRLSANHAALMPLLSDQREFYDPKNLPVLREKTKEMMLAAASMTNDPAAPNADPMIEFTAKEFANEMAQLTEMVDSGNLQQAHYGLSSVGNYCISCHSRADRGSKNFPIPWAVNLSPLSNTQKALFLLSNRQYESAHQETDKLLSDTTVVSQDPNTWMSVIQKDLAVVIRVQEDLKRAQAMVGTILKNKNLPSYMKYDVKLWQRSLKEWQSPKTKGADKNLAFVKKLIDQAQSNEYAQGQAAFIIYLRASGILHELLETSRQSPTYSSILYYAGITANALKTVDVWKLGEHYFEVCIENSPYTKISWSCYGQLEKMIQQTYPNRDQMPELNRKLQKKLDSFKDLAKPKNPMQEMIRTNESAPRF